MRLKKVSSTFYYNANFMFHKFLIHFLTLRDDYAVAMKVILIVTAVHWTVDFISYVSFWMPGVLFTAYCLIMFVKPIRERLLNDNPHNSRGKSSKRNVVIIPESGSGPKLQVTIQKSSDSGFDDAGAIFLPRIQIGNLNPFKIEYYCAAIACKFPLDPSWEFPRDRLTLIETIGKGNFGCVFKAKASGVLGKKADKTVNENQTGFWVKCLLRIIDVTKIIRKQEPTSVAIKTLALYEKQTGFRITCFLREIEIMKIIGNHENIVSLLGCCTQDGPLYAIFEYARQGDLRTYLVKRKDHVSEKSRISFASQVANGMEYLANVGCIHRDLAARNVLVFSRSVVKIADFGLARDLRGSKHCHPLEVEPIPFRWRAPETLENNIHETNSDM